MMNPRYAFRCRKIKLVGTMSDYDQYDVAVVAHGSASGQSSASGHTKRLRAAALPKVFLVMTAAHVIFGAMLIIRCQLDGNACSASWYCDRFVQITPLLLTKDMAAYMSSAFLLKPLVEQAIRAGPTIGGGVLNHHYLEHAQQQWKVWTCSVQDEAALRSSHGDLVCLYSKISRCRLLGVQPLKIIETLLPHMNIVRAAAVVEDGPIDESEGSAPAFSASALESPAASKLAGLNLPTSGGTVEHRFTVQGLLNCLRLAATSKPSASLADVLFAAAPLLLGDAAAQPVQAGLASALPLPSLDIIRCAGGNFAQTVKYTYEFAV